jgi:hypothetical protein
MRKSPQLQVTVSLRHGRGTRRSTHACTQACAHSGPTFPVRPRGVPALCPFNALSRPDCQPGPLPQRQQPHRSHAAALLALVELCGKGGKLRVVPLENDGVGAVHRGHVNHRHGSGDSHSDAGRAELGVAVAIDACMQQRSESPSVTADQAMLLGPVAAGGTANDTTS